MCFVPVLAAHCRKGRSAPKGFRKCDATSVGISDYQKQSFGIGPCDQEINPDKAWRNTLLSYRPSILRIAADYDYFRARVPRLREQARKKYNSVATYSRMTFTSS